MDLKRVALLEKFIAEDPTDPFPVYALALEYQGTEKEKEKAWQLFEQLLANHPEYLPTYYMAGNFFLEQNEEERAITILHRGLALAKAQNNSGTVREIRGVLDGLE